MKRFMEFCRFWMYPLSMLPLVVTSFLYSNWLALGVCGVAIFWAAGATIEAHYAAKLQQIIEEQEYE